MASRTPESGFALVELLVAIVIISVGIFGVITMVEGASRTTATNKSREGATALGREALEVTRSIRYADLTDSAIAAQLQSRSALADSSPAAGYTVARRGITYALTVSACSVDEDKDGLGPHEGAITFCPDSTATGTGDRNADDYRRVTIALSWTRDGVPKVARHTAVITNPAGGLGPAVTGLDLVGANPVTSAGTTSLSFNVTTSSTPASVRWSVNGDPKGTASGSGTAWSFSWSIASVKDGIYIVQAQAYDSEGRAGVAFKRTVTLNRSAPDPPGGFGGGRNGTPGYVDLEWHASPEGDVVGYRVYRSDALGNTGTRACPPSGDGADAVLQAASCIDSDIDLLTTQYYVMVAVDQDSAGNKREGPKSPVLGAPIGNLQPSTPLGLLLCLGSTVGCLGPDGLQAPSGTTVVSWNASTDTDGTVAFYRIYRDGIAYANRYDRLYPTGTLRYVDRNPGGQIHTYYVTAVDDGFAESPLSLPITG